MIFDNSIPIPPRQEVVDHYLHIIELLSKKNPESIYVFDLIEDRFIFISKHDLFLSGKSVDEITRMGAEYFSSIVHPEDYSLFIAMQEAMRHYLFHAENKPEDIDCFSCHFRIIHKDLSLMVHQKTIPVIHLGLPLMMICALSSSVIKKPGGLAVFYECGETYVSFSLKNQQWEKKKLPQLTKREKDILKLSAQGKQMKEISDILGISIKTVCNLQAILFKKLGMHSVFEVLSYANSYNLIF